MAVQFDSWKIHEFFVSNGNELRCMPLSVALSIKEDCRIDYNPYNKK